MKKRTLNEIRQSKEYQLAKDVVDANNKNPNVTTSNPFEHEEVDKTVDQIIEDLQPQVFDAIFQMINDEMTKRYVFDSSEYLTEAGLELFEDEWFEFFHNHHGDIVYEVMNNITN